MIVGMPLLGMISLAGTLVFVSGPASASSTTSSSSTPSLPLPPSTTTSASTTPTSPMTTTEQPLGPEAKAAARYFVINGTVDAASDHEIVGSSAFPNYSKGAVDNYYSMAHTHVDNSPFAEATASPFDTGPIGQTAAAGNFQQPQYADARWPGNAGKATYGTQGQPYATADASDYKAEAESSLASSGLSGPGPGGPSQIATPKGFDGSLQQALAAWQAKWEVPLGLKAPTPPAVKTPRPTVTTPAATVPAPSPPVGGVPPVPPVPPVTVPSVTVPPVPVPSAGVPQSATPSRSLSAAPADGVSQLESSTLTSLDPKTAALVTTGESSLGRVSLGGGQIVLEHIHVSASITNDGTPTYKVAVSVGAATIGGVPVTIDEDGVHVSGQGQGLPYKQASDALNGALKQAGIQLFLVSPEITKCDQGGGSQLGTPSPSGDTGQTTTTTSSTTTNSSGDTGTNTPTSSCDQGGPATDNSASQVPGTTTPTSPSGQPGTTTTTKSSGGQQGATTTTKNSGRQATTTTKSSGGQPGTTTTTTTPTSTTTSSGETGTAPDTTSAPEETITATGVHLVFTQPVQQSGVPAQNVEHILGEVSIDSLAARAGKLPKLNLFGGKTKKTSGKVSKGGGVSSAGGSSLSSSPSGSTSPSSSSQPTSGFAGSGSQPTSGSTGTAPQSFVARLASALRKPMWLLLAYLLWQTLVIATGASLWTWQRGGAS
jgi:hypothetical protein